MTDILHRLHCTIRCDIETAASGYHCAAARDEITALRAENERLRAALKHIATCRGGWASGLQEVARAALAAHPTGDRT